MLAQSGAAGVMIGRAAMGRPWLVGEIASGLAERTWIEPSPDQKRDAALEHLDALMTNMGVKTGLRHARKHLSAYAEHAGAPDALRLRLVTTDDPGQATALLGEAFVHLSGASLPAEAA